VHFSWSGDRPITVYHYLVRRKARKPLGDQCYFKLQFIEYQTLREICDDIIRVSHGFMSCQTLIDSSCNIEVLITGIEDITIFYGN
jgi:hypothetical protein